MKITDVFIDKIFFPVGFIVAIVYAVVGLYLLTGCGTTAKVNTVYDFQKELEGGNPINIITIEKPVTDNIDCGYIHLSHIGAGRPFNNREEDIIDGVYCSYKIW